MPRGRVALRQGSARSAWAAWWWRPAWACGALLVPEEPGPGAAAG